jgi:DNA-binding MarR family transcriptional regulator
MARLSILLALFDRSPVRTTQLAAHERVRIPTITVATRRLESLGLVKRSPDPTDSRAVLVDITLKGLAVQRESPTVCHAMAVAMLNKLSQADLDSLTEALAPLKRLADVHRAAR